MGMPKLLRGGKNNELIAQPIGDDMHPVGNLPIIKLIHRKLINFAWPIYLCFLITVVILVELITNLGEFNFWRATHWLFTYQYGFIKRGFVGTFANLIFQDRAFTKSFIYTSSIVNLLVLSILLFVLIAR